MSTGPYGTPPDEPGYPVPTPSPPAGAPPPYWQQAPVPGPAPRGPQHLGAIIAVAVAMLLVVGSIVGYVVIGFAYAQSRLDAEKTSYDTVVGHLNTLNDTVNSVKTKLNTGAVSTAGAASLQQDKALVDEFVTSSQTAQSEIESDDASLAAADASLKQNQWLTALSRSRLDRASGRISHLRAALAVAKTITADYVQIGGLFQATYSMSIDLDALGTKSQANDLTGAAAADVALKADVDKAIQLDNAPGVPPAMGSVLVEIQSFASDFAALVNAVGRNDSAGTQSAATAVEADSTKIQAADFSSIGAAIDGYYQPLIDQYNAEVDKANRG